MVKASSDLSSILLTEAKMAGPESGILQRGVS